MRLYWFLCPCVILGPNVTEGQPVSTRRPFVTQESTKASDVTHTVAAADTPLPHPSCVHCLNVIWQTKRLFIWSRNKTQHPPFTLSHTPNERCHLLKNLAVSFRFFQSSGAENFSPQIKEGIIAKMAEIPVLMPVLCCVCLCVRI